VPFQSAATSRSGRGCMPSQFLYRNPAAFVGALRNSLALVGVSARTESFYSIKTSNDEVRLRH
jgi:hypothetical protein